jgi:RimJ/RimL family protein N-acetyltransferase
LTKREQNARKTSIHQGKDGENRVQGERRIIPMMKIESVTLTGQRVRLEPLRLEHAPALCEALREAPNLWQYIYVQQPRSVEQMEQWVAQALQDQAQGTSLPFVIRDLASGQIVGSTRYLRIEVQHRGLEIGWSWLTPSAQRTGINTECKYLLLRHAFEQLGAIRVQLNTHSRNIQSQRAIERLGAVKEGVLRNNRIMPDGSYRHSVYYSIIESEWPKVKAELEVKMRRA